VYLFIEDGKYELKDAEFLWGKDNYQVCDILKNIYKGSSVISIGQAGENKVLFACIANDKGNFSGRCGLGAVMGEMKLKAIVGRGTKKIDFAEEEKLQELRKKLINKIKENIAVQSLSAFGSDSAMELGMMLGDVPIKNWQLEIWEEGSQNLSGPAMADTILVKQHSCFACPVGCKRVVKVEEPYNVEEGPGPEYETCASFGTLCYNKDLKAVAKINELCNRYGLDTISTGATIAYAIEAYEKGFLKETDGIKLEWGNPEIILKLLEKIVRREGIGELLSLGSKRVAEKLGKDAEEFLLEVKGLELPMHDPRAFHGMGLAYATSNRGACHVNSSCMFVEQGYVFYPEIGLEGPYSEKSSEKKAELNLITQNLGQIMNSACICLFAGIPFSAEDILSSLNFTTGFNFSMEEMLKTGERIWYLKRGINNLLGITKKDDRLPGRILKPVSEDTTLHSPPDIEFMLKEFYKLRELTENGYPRKEKLEKLNLKDLAEKLYKNI
jgi:aldehyde:ferredoxin oxidoreductase